MLPVFIEMPPTLETPQVECERALLEACSEAAQPERCERARADERRSSVVAVVSWQGEFSIRVEVGEHPLGSGLERHLSFSEEDPELERCRAAGYVTGTLLEALTQKEPDVGSAPPLAPERAAATTRAEELRAGRDSRPAEDEPRSSTPSTALYLDGGCLFGSGPAGALRYGPAFALGVRLASGLLLRGEGDMTFASISLPDGHVVPTRFWSLGAAAGAAWSFTTGTWLELAGGPFLENVQVTVIPGTASDARFVGGMRGSFALRRHLVDRVSALIAATGGMRFGDTTVRLDGADAARIPAPFGGGFVALSLDLR